MIEETVRKRENEVQLTINLTKKDLNGLNRLAEKRGISNSRCLRDLIRGAAEDESILDKANDSAIIYVRINKSELDGLKELSRSCGLSETKIVRKLIKNAKLHLNQEENQNESN